MVAKETEEHLTDVIPQPSPSEAAEMNTLGQLNHEIILISNHGAGQQGAFNKNCSKQKVMKKAKLFLSSHHLK